MNVDTGRIAGYVVHDMALYSSSYVLFLNHTVLDSSVMGTPWPTLETWLPIFFGRLLPSCYTSTRCSQIGHQAEDGQGPSCPGDRVRKAALTQCGLGAMRNCGFVEWLEPERRQTYQAVCRCRLFCLIDHRAQRWVPGSTRSRPTPLLGCQAVTAS
jgi:hypothetical protein